MATQPSEFLPVRHVPISTLLFDFAGPKVCPHDSMKALLAISSLTVGAAAFASSVPADDCGKQSPCSQGARAALAANAVEDKDIVTTAVEAGNFKTLARLLTAAELVETLQGEGPFTVFAPTDEAFAKLFKDNEKLPETLLKEENKGLLASILTYHVVPGKVMAKDVVKLSNAGTANGQRVDIVVEEGTVMVDGAKVTVTDIVCSNGVIHVIDTVIQPETKNLVEVAAGAKTFRTLIAAAQAAGLAKTLSDDGPFTIFAPTDEAFAALPKGTVESLLKPENKDRLAAILKNHVVSGRVYADQAAKITKAMTIGETELPISIDDAGAKVGDANITATDIEATNGVIHVIDAVLLP